MNVARNCRSPYLFFLLEQQPSTILERKRSTAPSPPKARPYLLWEARENHIVSPIYLLSYIFFQPTGCLADWPECPLLRSTILAFFRCWRPQQRWSRSDEEVDALDGLRQKTQQRKPLTIIRDMAHGYSNSFPPCDVLLVAGHATKPQRDCQRRRRCIMGT